MPKKWIVPLGIAGLAWWVWRNRGSSVPSTGPGSVAARRGSGGYLGPL